MFCRMFARESRIRIEMFAINCALFLMIMHSGIASRCVDHACSPPVGNLASGRSLSTLSGCCVNISHHAPCSSPHHLCPEDLHPPAHMADDPFLYPDTWWMSRAATGQQEEVRLDLETSFCLTHVVLLFRSPRPAAMAMERSRDYGQTWEMLKLFSHNCSLEFGLPDDSSHPGSLCTSRYSGASTCRGGEVIYRTLGPGGGVVDPYSPEALSKLTITNLRIRLLKAQTCKSSSSCLTPRNPITGGNIMTAQPTSELSTIAPFAIYTLLARGTCLCHGHAEHCLPHNSSQDTAQDNNMVPGRCVCTHQTAGEHCERCAPLYNDRPWRPANGSSGEPHPCQKCECHGHANSCHFSQRAWLSSGGTSGGVCDDCRHNTAGRRCQRCRHGYHRHLDMPLNSPHTCTRCLCDPVGSFPGPPGQEVPWCHSRSGQCSCRPGIGGTRCSHCLPGYWGFGEEGCKPCTCSHSCDLSTGHCLDSFVNNQVFNVPIGGKIPDMDAMMSNDGNSVWSKELAVSALHYSAKCICKDRKLRSLSDLCKTKHDYVIKASVLSAHDKGSHAEVLVKVCKVLRSGQVALSQGTLSLYPLSWTSRGCTCPILNPGVEYLIAGPEDAGTGRLLVTMQSVVVPWTPRLGAHISGGLRQGCP